MTQFLVAESMADLDDVHNTGTTLPMGWGSGPHRTAPQTERCTNHFLFFLARTTAELNADTSQCGISRGYEREAGRDEAEGKRGGDGSGAGLIEAS